MTRTSAILCVTSLAMGNAVAADRLAIDGVPVERVTVSQVRAATENIEVSKIRNTRWGDLTVSCHGSDFSCSVTSSNRTSIQVTSTSLNTGRTDATLQVQIKVGDTMATVSVMWEDCRSC